MKIFPSTRKPNHVYYLRDGQWWLRNIDELHTDAESVYMLDVILGVDDEYRAKVIAEHAAFVAGTVEKIYTATREGKPGRVAMIAETLRLLAESERSRIYVEGLR